MINTVLEPEIEVIELDEAETKVNDLLDSVKHIVVYDDDFNTFDHVINCFIKYCKHDSLQAEQCTLMVHHNGRCSVKNGHINKLKPICEALLENGLTAEIE